MREVFTLLQNSPNPFNPSTKIFCGLPERAHASLRIYDTSGRRVGTLVDEVLPRGYHERIWNGRDTSGAEVASGVYYYRPVSDQFQDTKRMVLLR